MRRLILLPAFLFVIQLTFGQLTVVPSENGRDNYLYVKGEVLYVANNLHLQKNRTPEAESSIFLRAEGQLIQGEEQDIPNSGTGSISIFQEGTSNAFDYNYWSSPVRTAENAVFGISMLHMPVSAIKSQPAKIVSALNGTANPLSISNRWIYTFSGNGYSNWNTIGGSTSIPTGYGFTMKGTDGTDPTVVEGRSNNPGNAQRYDFRGRPNSGTIEIPVTPDVLLLVGNPYPSAVDLSLFLLENSGAGRLKPDCYPEIERKNAITGIAYFWDSKEQGDSHYLDDYVGGYGAFSPIDPCTTGVYEKPLFKTGNSGAMHGAQGNHYDRRFLPVGQGFMVQGVENEKLQFKNSQRIFRKEGNHSYFKHAERKTVEKLKVIPKMQLLVQVNEEYTRSLSLAFWPTATTNVDFGMDAIAYDIAPADVGWLQNEESYVIDVRPFDISDEIPLFFKVSGNTANFRIFEGETDNFSATNLFILDTKTKTYHDLKQDSFSIELDPGNYHGRFKLVFYEKVEEVLMPEVFVPEEEVLEDDFAILNYSHQGEIQIIGNSISPVRSVGIFDLQGKRIYYRANFDNRRSISIATGNLPNALYIIKVTNMDNQITTKKIILF